MVRITRFTPVSPCSTTSSPDPGTTALPATPYGDALVQLLRVTPRGRAWTDAAGLGPFVTWERFLRPDGTVVDWSRRDPPQAGRPPRRRAGHHLVGSTAVGWWIGVLFAIGSVCFTVGAAARLRRRGRHRRRRHHLLHRFPLLHQRRVPAVRPDPQRAAVRARLGIALTASASGRGNQGASTGARAACSSSARCSSNVTTPRGD